MVVLTVSSSREQLRYLHWDDYAHCIARLTLVIAVIKPPSPVLHPALLPWHDSKLDGEVIQLYLNAGDMGRDQLLIAE